MPRDKKPRTNQPIRSIEAILKATQINGKSIFDPENEAFLDENKDNPSIAFLVKTNKLIREYELNSVLRLMLEGYIKEKSLMPILDYNKTIEVGTPEGRKAYFLMNTDKSTLIERALEVALIDIEPLLEAATTPTPNDAPGIREKILNFFSNLFKREPQQNPPQNVNPTPGLWERIKAFFSALFFKQPTQDRPSQQASSTITASSFDNAAFDPNKTLVGAQQFNAAADQLKAKKDLDIIESFALQALTQKAQSKDKPSTSESSKEENFLDILNDYLEEPKPEGESLIEAEPPVEAESSDEDVLEEDDIFKAIESSDVKKMEALLHNSRVNLRTKSDKGVSVLDLATQQASYGIRTNNFNQNPQILITLLTYMQTLPEEIQADIYNNADMSLRAKEISPFEYYDRIPVDKKDTTVLDLLERIDKVSKKPEFNSEIFTVEENLPIPEDTARKIRQDAIKAYYARETPSKKFFNFFKKPSSPPKKTIDLSKTPKRTLTFSEKVETVEPGDSDMPLGKTESVDMRTDSNKNPLHKKPSR